MSKIVGDPLTGSLPRTKLIVPQDTYGPVRQRRPRPKADQWPLVADQLAITYEAMRAGRIAYVRTARGIRRWQIRVVNRSREPGKHRGRSYIVGHDRKGWCHAAWADRVIRVETVQQALTAGRLLRMIGPAPSDSRV